MAEHAKRGTSKCHDHRFEYNRMTDTVVSRVQFRLMMIPIDCDTEARCRLLKKSEPIVTYQRRLQRDLPRKNISENSVLQEEKQYKRSGTRRGIQEERYKKNDTKEESQSSTLSSSPKLQSFVIACVHVTYLVGFISRSFRCLRCSCRKPQSEQRNDRVMPIWRRRYSSLVDIWTCYADEGE